jgi:hypothetical protein
MHALHLRLDHLWRVTLLAALATIVITVGLLLFARSLAPDGGPAPSVTPVVAPAQTHSAAPDWVANPLAPPAFRLPR